MSTTNTDSTVNTLEAIGAMAANPLIVSAAKKVADKIRQGEKSIDDLASAIIGHPASKSVLANVSSVQGFIKLVLANCLCERKTFKGDVSAENRYDYFYRTTVQKVAEGLGLVEKSENVFSVMACLEATFKRLTKEAKKGDKLAKQAADEITGVMYLLAMEGDYSGTESNEDKAECNEDKAEG